MTIDEASPPLSRSHPADDMATESRETPWWKHTWPLDLRQAKELGLALVATVFVASLVGFVLSDWTAPNSITSFDERLAQDLAEGRTSQKNDLATWGSLFADTPVKIAASALIVAAMALRWRRWHEAVFVSLTLIFEATAFIITTTIVRRPRPEVEQLVHSPVDTSFPSGHVAAATVYLAIGVVVAWHVRNQLVRLITLVALAAIPLIVAWARLYQGMHYFSDVVAGVVLGLASIWIVLRVMGAPDDAAEIAPDPGTDSHTTLMEAR